MALLYIQPVFNPFIIRARVHNHPQLINYGVVKLLYYVHVWPHSVYKVYEVSKVYNVYKEYKVYKVYEVNKVDKVHKVHKYIQYISIIRI